MPYTGAERSPGGAHDEDKVQTLQGELARMLGEHVERRVVEPVRREAGRRSRLLGGVAPPPPGAVELDPAVVDAITLAVDASLAALLPGLVEDAVARVLPDAIDAAVTDLVEAINDRDATPGPVVDRAATTLRTLRKAWGA